MSLNPMLHLEVWNKLPLTDQQRQDLLKDLIEENDHTRICPTVVKNMTKLAQIDEPDLLKLPDLIKIMTKLAQIDEPDLLKLPDLVKRHDLVKQSEILTHTC
jgi:hypothetical protein